MSQRPSSLSAPTALRNPPVPRLHPSHSAAFNSSHPSLYGSPCLSCTPPFYNFAFGGPFTSGGPSYFARNNPLLPHSQPSEATAKQRVQVKSPTDECIDRSRSSRKCSEEDSRGEREGKVNYSTADLSTSFDIIEEIEPLRDHIWAFVAS